MPLDSQKVFEEIHEETLGSLGGCLVEGDPEQRNRERRVRRRALVISILTQTAILTLLVLVPLFGKMERIPIKNFVPIPPYGHVHNHPDTGTKSGPDHPINVPTIVDHFVPPTYGRPVTPSHGGDVPVGPPDIGLGGNEQASGPECSWCINIGDKNSEPRPPQPAREVRDRPQILHFTHLDPAMLIHRVEPVYPPLARQIHREGRVELRAIVATDGTIQSLEIVAGDPIFYQSAIDAVSQWRYKPTVLNGQPVEIDTYITVIYMMSH